ncbi:hypothetical protein F2Q69_00012311 [Brassica cretica]|uniref:Uncharacterized protein n=1 Tax=Brassica cretica TaxID=69181 RepID=A0A8S9R6W4_BRACR|nr:hypothetical protein F2Q69_00012311 [Brassica cretica]
MAAVSIRFTQETSMVEIPETINLIPKEVFMNTYLPRYGVKTTYNDETQTIQRIVANLRLERIKFLTTPFTQTSGCMFQCFDGLGALLHEKLVASGCIHLPTWILPKLVVGMLIWATRTRLLLKAWDETELVGFDPAVESDIFRPYPFRLWSFCALDKLLVMKLPMGGATPPAQNAIESFSVDFRHSHVHTAITTTQLEFSGTLSNSVGQIGQIPLGFVAFDGDMTKQTNSCAEEITRLTGEDDNTGDDMPGVGAVKSTPSIDVTKEVPADSARPSRG